MNLFSRLLTGNKMLTSIRGSNAVEKNKINAKKKKKNKKIK